jgi:hypothetical protein
LALVFIYDIKISSKFSKIGATVMRKKIILFYVLVFLALSVFAQENTEDTTASPNPGKLSFGLNYVFGAKLDMAVGADFGFLIFHNNELDIRNNIMFNSYLITDDDDIESITRSISDKITFGWINPSGFARPYAFFEGGIGFYGNDSKGFWEMPLAYSAGFGIGSEFFGAKTWSFFLDTGAMWQFFDQEIFMVQKFTMGMRYYF